MRKLFRERHHRRALRLADRLFLHLHRADVDRSLLIAADEVLSGLETSTASRTQSEEQG